MTPEVREGWEAKSRADKERYQREMAVYKETNRMSSKKPKKDPSAPKRPMSAFLAFSNKRRAALKREHPDSTNADLSKMLSKMWKEIDPAYKAEYVEDEAQKRAQYKLDIVKWRKKKAEQTRAINKAAAAAEKTATAAAAAAPPQAMMTATSTSDAAKRMEAFNNSNMAPMNQFNGGGYASQFLSNAGMMSQQPHHQFFPPQGVPCKCVCLLVLLSFLLPLTVSLFSLGSAAAQQQMMGMSGMSSLVPNQYQQQHALLQYQQLVQQQNALQQQQFSMDGAGSPQQQKHYMGGFAPGPPMP